MSLESASFVNDLVITNPGSTDAKAQGDDHLRLIKTAVKASFPNSSRAFYLATNPATKTTTVTVAASDQAKVYACDGTSGAFSVNLPANAGIPDGFEVSIFKTDASANAITIDPDSSDTINGAATLALSTRWSGARCVWLATFAAWIAFPMVGAGGADLAIADGGTGQSTAILAFNALSPITTRGDIITRDATNNIRLAIGAADTLLKSDGTDLAYGKVINANITDGVIAYAKLDTVVTATQAIQETGTATDSFVTPGRQKFNPGHPKAWLCYNMATATVRSSHGVTSVTHNSTGIFTVNFSVTFSAADAYGCTGWARYTQDNGAAICSGNNTGTKSTTAMSITTRDINNVLIDCAEVFVAFYGDLA